MSLSKLIRRNAFLLTIASLSLAACSTGSNSTLAGSGSGRETGGVPPAAESTHVVFSTSLADGLFASDEWTTMKAVIAALPQDGTVCAKTFFEDTRGSLKIVGAMPDQLRAVAQTLGLTIPAGVQLNAASHFGYCRGFEAAQVQDDAFATLLNETLAAHGTRVGSPRFSSYEAAELSCRTPFFSDTTPACWLRTAAFEVVEIQGDAASQLTAGLLATPRLRPLHGDLVQISSLRCSSRELFGPNPRHQLVCTFSAPRQ